MAFGDVDESVAIYLRNLTSLHEVVKEEIADATDRIRAAKTKDDYLEEVSRRNQWVSLKHRIEKGINP